MIGYGGTFGAVSSSVDATQNFAKGNYTRGFIDAGSIGLSYGRTTILKRMYSNGNISFHSRYLIDGGSSLGQTPAIDYGENYLLPKESDASSN